MKKIKRFFKELFTAHYDREKDIIVNCEEKSLIWYHEKGHQIAEKNNSQSVNVYLASCSLYVCIGFLCLNHRIFALLFFFCATTLLFLTEIVAWVIGIKLLKNDKKQKIYK